MTQKEFNIQVVALSSRMFPMALRLLNNNEDARDAVQDVLVKLWNQRRKLKKHDNINGYVFLTLRNHCLDMLKKLRPLNLDHTSIPDSGHNNSSSSKAENGEALSIVMAIARKLPEVQREVFMLKDMDGLEYTEIAEILDLKESHIRVLLSRARKEIRAKLQKIYDYEKGTVA
ncbi:RNA polymerase sigma factor [Puteibacter caeruleilacunae]|nr:RNA polymerase sigma factor [Puteibacter caeruleilacunae]